VTDDERGPLVAIVNDVVAAHYWPGQDVIGKRFRLLDRQQPWVEIVGVASRHKYRALSESPTEFVYYPRMQRSAPLSTILVATDQDAAALAAPLREIVRAIDPDLPVFDVRTLDDLYRAYAVSVTQVIVEIVGGMGSMGLALAVAGLYALVAYSVSRRTREIGIRMAVGANPVSVLRMVLQHGLWLAVGGVVVGVIGSVSVRGLLGAAFSFPDAVNLGVTTHLLVVPILLAVTLLAAYIPARRASRIDPLSALRQQ